MLVFYTDTEREASVPGPVIVKLEGASKDSWMPPPDPAGDTSVFTNAEDMTSYTPASQEGDESREWDPSLYSSMIPALQDDTQVRAE